LSETVGAGAPQSEFQRSTAVWPEEDRWVGEIDPAWNVGTNPNGGYTLAIAGRAMLAASGRADPLSLTAHYVASPRPGTVTIGTETVRAGRRYATLAGSMSQDGKDLVRLLGAFGDLTAQEGPTRIGASPPTMPPPERCVSLVEASDAGGFRVPRVLRRYELRVNPAERWWQSVVGSQKDEAPLAPLEITGWIRFADGTEPSVLALLAMVDAFPPTLFGRSDIGWIPTVELTVHVRGRPAPGWMSGRMTTRFLVDGVLEEDGELWDSAGHLVALSRQMALVLPRR
jgi:acyl-CoA thioesterase